VSRVVFVIDFINVIVNAMHSGQSGYYLNFSIMDIPICIIPKGVRATRTHCIYRNLNKIYMREMLQQRLKLPLSFCTCPEVICICRDTRELPWFGKKFL